MYCSYYQARVREKDCWYLVGILRSFEHLVFDRTHDKTQSIFEFFVPEHNEKIFEEIMNYFIKEDIVTDYRKLPNRLLDSKELI